MNPESQIQPEPKEIGERQSSRNQVRDAITSLLESEIDITSETIARFTGLKMVTVNDCIKNLHERGEIVRLNHGRYKPNIRHEPSRTPSLTITPTGTVKLEIGDDMIEFTPREVQIIAPFFAGINLQVAASEYNHTTMLLAERLAKSERKIRALEKKRTDADQLPLDEVEVVEDPRQLRMEV